MSATPVPPDRSRAASFHVLVVCTANQCRSPIAEHLLRHAVETSGLDWTVSSAGTDAEPGSAHPLAVQVLAERALAVAPDWAARRLTNELTESADLILTATAAHRRAVVTLGPGATARTYPLLQFARLAGVLRPASVDGGPELLGVVPRVRGRVRPVEPAVDDLRDPIGGLLPDYRVCADTVQQAIGQILAPIRPGVLSGRTGRP